MEHVEDLEAWLVDGEDDGSVRVCQPVQMAEELEGGCCIQPCESVCVCVCVCVCYRLLQRPHTVANLENEAKYYYTVFAAQAML